jgi:uncharacterized membrane protein YcaP (DUF421 family)
MDTTTTWHTFLTNLTELGAPPEVTWAEKVIRPIVVYLALVSWLRWKGRRVLAQLNPFDFVLLLMLANTVQNAVIGNDTSLAGGLLGAFALVVINSALVWLFHRSPSRRPRWKWGKELQLVHDGKPNRTTLHRLRINAEELTARAHERGFDSLKDVDCATMYPNGTIYFQARPEETEAERHAQLLGRLDHLAAEIAALRG